jgi:H+/gluconate symporter-like permease
MTTIATGLKLLVLSLATWAAAFAARQALVPNIVPIAWADEPQALWAVEAAFLLRAIENIAAAVTVVALIVLATGWIERVRRRHQRTSVNGKKPYSTEAPKYPPRPMVKTSSP